MKLNRIFVAVLLLLALFLLSVAYLNSGVRAASSSVVISEFRTRGPNGGNDEFVELYNLSSSVVDLSGWKIHGSNAAAATSVRAVIPNGTSIGAHCHYLIGNSNATAGPYSGSTTPDQTYSVGITDDGGIALTRGDDSIVDQVGLSAGSAFLEGSPLSPNTQNTNHSYERKPGGSAGSGQDTDNNQADFRAVSSAGPENRSSQCAALDSPTNPTGVGAVIPMAAQPGETILLTVTVTRGINPLSTGLVVTGDLRNIGGEVNRQFFDDGRDGDVVLGDGIFSLRTTIGAQTQPGPKHLPITISDAQSRTGIADITIGIELPDDACSVCGIERWSIKTGRDQDAKTIYLSNVQPTTIEEMRSWTAPVSLSNILRDDREKTVYIVSATLTLFKKEDDSDYHLVLADGAGRTMIAEIPCPVCVDASSPFTAMILDSRTKFNNRLQATTAFQPTNLPVRVTGVGFFDFAHGQTGAAPNQIELHPVLDVRFDVDLRKPLITGASIAGKKLFVTGLDFDAGALIFVNGIEQNTANRDDSPTTILVAKKGGKKISSGQAVDLQVQNSNGVLSDAFQFIRP